MRVCLPKRNGQNFWVVSDRKYFHSRPSRPTRDGTSSAVEKFVREDDGGELVVKIDRGDSGKFRRADPSTFEVCPVKCVSRIPEIPRRGAPACPKTAVIVTTTTFPAVSADDHHVTVPTTPPKTHRQTA